ncbi:lactadherin-like [Branchiostoma floridae x Branchiostoma japonicum]
MRPLLDRTLQILLKLSLLRAVAASDCPVSSPLGMESGVIEDSQISAFSFRTSNEPYNARLNGNNEWRADDSDQNQWLQVDLHKTIVLTGIQTQGQHNGRDRYVTSFEVSYSDDEMDWTVFTGNSDQNQV